MVLACSGSDVRTGTASVRSGPSPDQMPSAVGAGFGSLRTASGTLASDETIAILGKEQVHNVGLTCPLTCPPRSEPPVMRDRREREALGFGGPVPALAFDGCEPSPRVQTARQQTVFHRRPVTKGHVRTALVVVTPPGLDGSSGLSQGFEPVQVQTLVAQGAIERLDCEYIPLPGKPVPCLD